MLRQLDEGRMQVVEHDRLLLAPWPSSRRPFRCREPRPLSFSTAVPARLPTAEPDATTDSYFYSPVYVCYDNWTKDVCRWWNTIVYCWRRGRRPDGVDVDRPNRCLYVYGSTAAGKSTYVETILSAAGSRRSPNPLRHVYYPGVGRYFTRHFDANLHHAIVFEEFDVGVGQYNVAMLKRLCEGRTPDDTYIRSAAGEPFLRRLFAVHAAVPYWHADRIIVPDSCYDDDDVEAQASTSSSSDATMVLLSSASAPPAAVEHDDDDNIISESSPPAAVEHDDDDNIISESSSSDSSRTKSIEFGY
ncbi:hypothetical protein QE152_g23018 [Popillia japonica]|uniref:Uncharacterized protein n=1 Tax=Popillia japonica TaxID=7064 RepID=A0AAW1KIT9_POPJA